MKSIQESLITRLKVRTKIGNQIKAAKCNNCGHIRNPPRTYCNRCQGDNFTDIILGPMGEIVTYSSTYKKKATDKQRIFGIVQLYSEDKKDTISVGGSFNVENIDDLEVGQKVELTPRKKYNVFKLMEE